MQAGFKLQEWQAILAAYAILLVGAQTSLAPLAVLSAWGVSITYFITALKGNGHIISDLFSSSGPGLSDIQSGSASGIGPATGVGSNPEPNQPAGPTISGNQCYDQYGRPYHCP